MISNSWLDSPEPKAYVQELIAKGENNQKIANLVSSKFDIEVSRHAISRFRKRHSSSEIGMQTIQTENFQELNDPEKMIRDRGLDPEVWQVDSCSVTEWEGPTTDGKDTFHHAKLNLKQVKNQIRPARSDGWKAPPKVKRENTDRFIVCVGDQHAPYQDKILESLFCQWLETNTPDEGICLGDVIDAPSISRHPNDPENDVSINECIQSAYDMLRGYVVSSPNTEWKMLYGNHDERIKKYIIENAEKLYNLKQADNHQSIFSLNHLLRLDELDIELIDPHGPYANGQVTISPLLSARHGWLANKDSGVTALKTLEALGHSVIVGHSHRMAVVHRTTYDNRGNPITLIGAEAGCMCQLDKKHQKSLAYTVAPNWQAGFLTIQVDKDGEFVIEMARYINKKLYWRDQVYYG